MKLFDKTKKKIKFMAVFLCVCLIIGLSINQVGILQFTKAADIWDGTIPVATDNAKYSGNTNSNGTIRNPYILASAKDLAQFAVNVNAGKYSGQTVYVNLQADIDLSNYDWLPIGTSANPFTGVFDGGNHTISNMKITIGGDVCKAKAGIGLFGDTTDSSISNIAVTGTISQGTQKEGTDVGGVVGRASTTSLSNCSFKGSVVGNQYVGGLVGTAEGTSAAKCTFSKCSVLDDSTVTSTKYAAGGLIGYAAKYVYIVNSFNRSSVKVDAGSEQGDAVAAAGIVGSTGDGFLEIINSYNIGAVDSSYLAGGIVNGKNITLKVCYNAGKVTSNSNTQIGGISGTGSDNSKGNSFESCFYLQDDTTGLYSAYPGTFVGSSKNIGTVANNQNYTYLVKESALDSSKWTLGSQKTLLDALNDGVSTWADAYSGILEWGYDNKSEYVVNKNFPIHTSKVGHVHDRGKEEVIKEATCTEEGTVRYTCSICGNPEVVTIPALGHSYKETVLTPAACEVSGVSANVCERCGDVLESWETKPIGHRWKEGVVHEATCTEPGSVRTECMNSGCTAVREVTETLPALGHDTQTKIVARTCTTDEVHITTCTRCDYELIETLTGTALGHDWDSVSGVSVASTCTVHGGMVRTCKRCKVAQTVNDENGNPIIYPYAAHTYEDTIIDPTCTENGYTHHECKVCGSELNDTYTEPLGHSYVATVVEPTCSTKGYTRHQCTRCDYYYDDNIIDATDKHSYVKDESQSYPASCLSEGLDVYVCEYCHKATIQETIPSFGGHQYIYSAEKSVAQTCENGGYDMWICKVCLAEEKRNVTYKGFGHSYVSTVHAPTCLDDGYTEYVCSTCGNTYIDDRVSALGHDYVQEVIPPTTTTRGYTLYKCSRCDEEYESDYIAATPDASFNYLTLTLNLSDMDELMQYSIDGGVSWTAVEVSSVSVSAEALNPEYGIQVKRPGNDVLPMADSEIQTIEIVKASQPQNVISVKASAERPGMIVGVNSSMEYRAEDNEEWLPIMSDMLEGLSEGVYYVRVKATENSLASDAVRVEIKGDTTPTPDNNTTATPDGDATPTPTIPIIDITATPNNVTDIPVITTPPISSITPSVTTPPVSSIIPSVTKTPDSNKTQAPSGSAAPTGGNSITNTNKPSNNGGNNNSSTGNDNINSASDGNNSGSNVNSDNQSGSDATATPGIVENQVYYSSNGGASSSGSSKTTTKSSTYKAAKTGDESNIAVWLLIAFTAASTVVIARKKKTEN